jgi:hypothetical protein
MNVLGILVPALIVEPASVKFPAVKDARNAVAIAVHVVEITLCAFKVVGAVIILPPFHGKPPIKAFCT